MVWECFHTWKWLLHMQINASPLIWYNHRLSVIRFVKLSLELTDISFTGIAFSGFWWFEFSVMGLERYGFWVVIELGFVNRWAKSWAFCAYNTSMIVRVSFLVAASVAAYAVRQLNTKTPRSPRNRRAGNLLWVFVSFAHVAYLILCWWYRYSYVEMNLQPCDRMLQLRKLWLLIDRKSGLD